MREHRSPFLTDAQVDRADQILLITSSIGFALAALLLFLWRSDKYKAQKNYLITTIITLSLGTTLSFLIIRLDGLPAEKKLCYDNAIPMDQSDGPSICVAQSVLLVFFVTALSLSWLAQTIDLYLTVVKGVKGSSRRYFRHYMALIFIYPSIAIIILAGLDDYGYAGMLSSCAFGMRDNKTGAGLIVEYIPIFIIMITGSCLIATILLKIGKIWLSSLKTRNRVSATDNFSEGGRRRKGDEGKPSSSSIAVVVVGEVNVVERAEDDAQEPNNGAMESARESLKKTWKKNIQGMTSLLAFLLIFLAVWIMQFCNRVRYFLNQTQANASYNEWQRCIYDNFDGVSDSSWMGLCGEQPEYYANGFIEIYYLSISLAAGNSIAACIPFLREFFVACKLRAEEEVDRELVRILQIRKSAAERRVKEDCHQGGRGRNGLLSARIQTNANVNAAAAEAVTAVAAR